MEFQAIKDDRNFGGNKPFIDLTPAGLWGEPLKELIGDGGYDLLASTVAQRAGNLCELCGAGPKVKGLMGKCAHKFKMEPRFEYDEKSGRATLKRLMHICNQCGQSIHLRQTQLESRSMPQSWSPMVGAVARLMKFYDVSEEDVLDKLSSELDIWATRDIVDVDLTVATDAIAIIMTERN